MRVALAVGFSLCLLSGQALVATERPTEAVRLWPEKAPAALGEKETDIPTLTPFWADEKKATGAAMIVLPGGGYRQLAAHEGAFYAQWLRGLGIHALVLKYRLTTDGYHLPEIVGDGSRAVRMVRANAKEWGIDPQRIGVIGSSAGGHLSAMLLTQNDDGKPDASDPIERASSRPTLGVLCYAFILADGPGQLLRVQQWFGGSVSDSELRRFTPARNVTAMTPPCFVWQTVEDRAVLVENAMVFAEALRKATVPFELHLYQQGRHGIGLGTKEPDPKKFHPWVRECERWLGVQGFLGVGKEFQEKVNAVCARLQEGYAAWKGPLKSERVESCQRELQSIFDLIRWPAQAEYVSRRLWESIASTDDLRFCDVQLLNRGLRVMCHYQPDAGTIRRFAQKLEKAKTSAVDPEVRDYWRCGAIEALVIATSYPGKISKPNFVVNDDEVEKLVAWIETQDKFTPWDWNMVD